MITLEAPGCFGAGRTLLNDMSYSLNSQYSPQEPPYSSPLYSPLYHLPLRSLDYSLFGMSAGGPDFDSLYAALRTSSTYASAQYSS